jgi:anti-sigma factor RsiW
MDCRQALTELSDLSADGLSSSHAQELMQHLSACPECETEWQAFQTTLFRLSSAPQALPSQEQSRQIWAACLEEISRDVERKRAPKGLFGLAPRWSWAALAGAAAVFGGVLLLAPQAETATNSPAPTRIVRFENPPEPMTALVNHHAGMSFDAFNDHVGSTLVSYRATAPANQMQPLQSP